MVLRKLNKIPFRWRLFIPTVLMIWSIIGVMAYIQYNNETSYRTQVMRNELSLIEQRIIYSYERGFDLVDFMKFIDQYYSHTVFNSMRVSVYDDHDTLIASVGKPIPANTDELVDLAPSNPGVKLVDMAQADPTRTELFYTNTLKSRDGHISVKTALPYSYSVSRALETSSHIWIILAIVTAVATLIVFFSTRLVSRNILLLKKLANQASNGEVTVSESDFPNDELGEISREILSIYNQRTKALERSEREHRVALHAIEEKANIKRQMTNNINHELKTPIGVIRGYLETIAENPDMDEATRNHFLKRTRDNVERLCSLLNDVSTITRLEEGSDNIPLGDVDMHDLLFSIENDVEAAKLAGGMSFTYNVPLNCHVLGNQNLLTGMILNLIKNSAMHSHGTQIYFKLVSESTKTYVFAFGDNGVGVGAEHIPHLFDRFYRVDSGRSRKAGGTGLGLPIVKSTIQSLGGAISVHNRSTGGLEIVFTLRKYRQ